MTEIPTPCAIDCETELLSALFGTPSFLSDAVVLLKPTHFQCPANRSIFGQLRDDFMAGREITVPLVTHRMHAQGTGALSHDRLAEMSSAAEYWPPAVFSEQVEVLERYRQLRIGREHIELMSTACREMNLSGLKEATERLVNGLTHAESKVGHTAREVCLEQIEAAFGEDRTGVPTGFGWLDGKIGNLQRQNLIIIAGPRAGGKSALAGNIAYNVAALGHSVSYHSHEMSRKDVFQRMTCIEGIHSSSWLKQRFEKHERTVIDSWMKDRPVTRIRIYDELNTADELCTQMRLDAMRFNTRLWIVDLLQRVKGDRSEGRERELSEVAWRLKQTAQKLNGTVIACSHLNKELTTRGSEDIENHADQVLVIGVKKEKQPGHIKHCLVKITKNRNGQSDVRCLYDLTGPHYRFSEVGETDEDIVPQKAANHRGAQN